MVQTVIQLLPEIGSACRFSGAAEIDDSGACGCHDPNRVHTTQEAQRVGGVHTSNCVACALVSSRRHVHVSRCKLTYDSKPFNHYARAGDKSQGDGKSRNITRRRRRTIKRRPYLNAHGEYLRVAT